MEKSGSDQHFMTDEKIIKEILKSAGIKRGDVVLEIGAGTGNLTKHLAGTGAYIYAVEIDTELCRELRKRFKGVRNVRVIEEEGLKYIDKGRRFDVLVSNLPYSICEPLLRRLSRTEFRKAILTVPKLFYLRLSATEGNLYSRMSFVFSRVFRIEKLMDVPREAFEPRPRTDSVVIGIERRRGGIQDFLIRERMLVKNAAREALCRHSGMTKREARSVVLRLPGEILEKRVGELRVEELEMVEMELFGKKG